MKLLGRNILQRSGKKSEDGNDGNAAANGNGNGNGNGNNSGGNGTSNANRNSSSSDANANGKRRKKKDKDSKNVLRRPRQQYGETNGRGHGHGHGHGHGQRHPSANAHHYQGQGSMNGSSILSIPTGEYDDSTIDANTLYEWSIADNAPSIGSAADIFMSQKTLNDVNLHDHEHQHQHQQEHDYGDNASMCSTGSEDEHDDDGNKKVRQLPNDNDDNDDLGNNDGIAMHSQFQYCKLTDSPPSKQKADQTASVDGSTTKGVKLKNKLSIFGHRMKGASSSVTDKEIWTGTGTGTGTTAGSISSGSGPNNGITCTPTRGGISYTTRPQHHHMEKLPSPSKIKPKTQRHPLVPLQRPLTMSMPMPMPMPLSAPIPLQTARRISCPVDVDSFLPEDPNDDNYSNSSPLPAELKGRIHAMSFEDDENDDELNSTFESGASDGTGISAKGSLDNVGDANSPFRRYRALILQGHEKGFVENGSNQTLVKKIDESGGVKANNHLNTSKQCQAGLGLSVSVGGNASSTTASNTHEPITHQMPGNSLSQSYPLTKASSLSYFSSTRNLGDMNSPHNIAAMGTHGHGEGMIQKSISMEPSFTFSINSNRRSSEGDSGDSGESDDASGASRWLLNKKSGTRNLIRGSFHAHEDTHDIPINRCMSSDSDANGWEEDSVSSSVMDTRESHSIASSAAASAGTGASGNKDVSINSSSGSTAAGSKNNGKRLRKNIKNQVRNKFHSIVKKKTKDRDRAGNSSQSSDVNGSTSCSSALEKPRFGKRQSSVSSMAPLTGIENYARPKAVIGKRRDTDLAKEVARRKATERREIERKQVEKQHRVEMARLKKQRQQDAKRWKTETLAFSHSNNQRGHGHGHLNAQRSIRTDDGRMGTIDALESKERLKNKKKLQDWVMGGFNGNGAYNGRANLVEPSHSNTSVMNFSVMSDGTSANKSAHTQETNVVDNTTAGSRARARVRERAEGKKQRGIVTKAFNAFDPSFLDEDDDIDNDSSTAALTPEAIAPSTDAVHDFSCVLCKKSERTHLAVPCMHFSFCGECVADLERKHEAANSCINDDGSEKNVQMRCLVCNETVTSFSKVFY